ncbi:MAG: hypothetical protein B7X99_13575 [Rhizobiales bacterium 17-65-6]|nr:MAG: hypothetical protein B7X99_13575 [Rhizobiales bacterium 17-65-6]
MTAPRYPIQISTDLWASGCLPHLLEREIRSVERRLGGRFTSLEVADNCAEYLAQLKAMRAAVAAAREVRP